jgi:hypothetical protein
MEKTKLDMSAFLKAYEAQVAAEAAHRKAVLEGLAAAPQGQWCRWQVSDRH